MNRAQRRAADRASRRARRSRWLSPRHGEWELPQAPGRAFVRIVEWQAHGFMGYFGIGAYRTLAIAMAQEKRHAVEAAMRGEDGPPPF